MDVGAFVQENRRWLLGCGLGVLVYVVGSAVLGSIYDPASVLGQARREAGAGKDELYGQDALKAAQAEEQALAAELERLRGELEFKPDARYQLAGKAMAPDDYLAQAGRSLKQSLLQDAARLEVKLLDKDVVWPAPVDAEGVRSVLFGLELLEETCRRLFAAHAEVRQAAPDAVGLRAITGLKVDDKRSVRSTLRPVRAGEVDLRDLVDQERLTFSFQCDGATAARFLEKCRQPGKALLIESLSMTQAQRPGEPVTVKGTLLGIAFRAAEEGKQP